MIICDKPKFLFIHVEKVAGQSISEALMPVAATSLQKLASRFIPYRRQLQALTLVARTLHLHTAPKSYRDHIPAQQLRDILGGDYSTYFSFAFVRNPWNWVYSQYTYTMHNKRHRNHNSVQKLGSFTAFCEWLTKQTTIYDQSHYVTDNNGKIIVDFIGRYERLPSDFHSVCDKLGIRASLPHSNKSDAAPNPWPHSPETIALIGSHFKRDVELFGYEPPEPNDQQITT